MARRNLEKALKAGQRIEQGLEIPGKFTQLRVINEHKFDASHGEIFSLQYSFGKNISETVLAVGFGSSSIMLFDALTGKFLKEVRKPRYGGEMHILCLRFHPREGKTHLLYASTADGKIYCFDTTQEPDDQVEPIIFEEGNSIFSMDFTADGHELITCGSDLSVRMYDADKKFKLLELWKGYNSASESDKLPTTSMRLFALKCHPLNDEIFITGGWDNHVKVWDKRNPGDPVKRVISGPHIVAEGIDIKGNEDTNQAQILTASDRPKDALQIWDYTSGKLLDVVPFDFTGPEGAKLYCAQFCDNDVVIAGGAGTMSMQAIDCQEKKVIGEVKFKAPVYCLDSVFGGRHFAVGSKDRTLVLGELC